MKMVSKLILPLFVALCSPTFAQGQEVEPERASIDTADIILPQRRIIHVRPAEQRAAIEVRKVNVSAVASKNRVETTIDLTLTNPGNVMAEARIIMPVTEGAVFKTFSYGKDSPAQYTARIMPADEARTIYNRIVAQIKDPALLEFAGFNAIRTSVFPIEAGAEMKARIVYEEIIDSNQGRFDYILPRSESFDQKTEWNIRVEIDGDGTGKPVNIYSPTHEIKNGDLKQNSSVVNVAQSNGKINPGPFRLSWRYENDATREIPDISMFACPSQEDPNSGYFLLTFSPRKALASDKTITIPRDITFVLDRSGSMRGEKLDKVKESVKQIIGGLHLFDRYNIITYNQGVDLFRDKPVEKSKNNETDAFAWIDQINARGGTNIYDALSAALNQPTQEGRLSIVLFLTDGLPTIGNTSEKDIVKLVQGNNKDKKRIFSVGVGSDLNSPLIRRISTETGAVCTFILPKEDVEVKIGELFDKLDGPIATNIRLDVQPNAGRIRDMLPSTISDLYAGTQVVITGQYIGNAPITFKLSSQTPNGERQLTEVQFDPAKTASIKDDFAARLWATRQIASLQEALRDIGIDTTNIGKLSASPKTKEIAEEILRLSVQFGIMSNFTSFFADDGKLTQPQRNLPAATSLFLGSARDDLSSVVAESNISQMKGASALNKDNKQMYLSGSATSIASSQDIYQIGQASYYYNDKTWEQNAPVSPLPGNDETVKTIIIGTPEYDEVVTQLVKENRQGVLAIDGNIKLRLNNEAILLKNSK